MSKMKRIGILGGMSPESTVAYYETITRTYTERFGDYGYPEVLIHSVSFQPYVDWPNLGRWDLVGSGLAAAAQGLERAGADFVLIATNTMHIVVDDVRAAIGVPVLNLLDVVGDAIERAGLTKVGLLGTAFTMSHPLYRDALGPRGIEVLVPGEADQATVHRVIYDELVAGKVLDASRQAYVEIVGRLVARGAQGMILGCTEIPLLVGEADVSVSLFDTTRLHAEAALQLALEG